MSHLPALLQAKLFSAEWRLLLLVWFGFGGGASFDRINLQSGRGARVYPGLQGRFGLWPWEMTMLNPTSLLADALGRNLAETYRRIFGEREPQIATALDEAARLVIERIASSD